jgi:RNA polymerase sigma factor (sigma-70 family)
MIESFHTRQTLLQRVKLNQDQASWNEFASYYKKYIYLICRRMTLNHHDAEEVVQSVLIKLLKKLPQQEGQFERFRAWLCTVTGNCVRDFMRKQITRDKYESKATEFTEMSAPEIEAIAEQEWQRFVVKQAIENVTPNFSKELMKIFFDLQSGLSLNEVAEQHQLPVNTISVYKGRVLKAVYREVRRLDEELNS